MAGGFEIAFHQNPPGVCPLEAGEPGGVFGDQSALAMGWGPDHRTCLATGPGTPKDRTNRLGRPEVGGAHPFETKGNGTLRGRMEREGSPDHNRRDEPDPEVHAPPCLAWWWCRDFGIEKEWIVG
eukprot:scaffold843_cov330-Pavlova_lutheri.AAC.5